jgi:hypothetical protein
MPTAIARRAARFRCLSNGSDREPAGGPERVERRSGERRRLANVVGITGGRDGLSPMQPRPTLAPSANRHVPGTEAVATGQSAVAPGTQPHGWFMGSLRARSHLYDDPRKEES